jgi:hypothetical protein
MSRTNIATTSTASTSTPACVEVHYQVAGSLDAYRTRAAGISGVRARVLPVVPDLSRATFGERAGV